ncbi:HAD family hydrolase [Sneathiella sp.]|jgi:HAD superfamily hydrolase (TIGR01509 family)|uniref:HAD family hydrolase n=1 Tax=Sneathiella sp. TaxID=1964365 RepID=UPI0039E2E029
MRDAVIFDMDGLLLDTERISLAAFKQTCDAFDLPFDPALYNTLVGCNMVHIEGLLNKNVEAFPGTPFMDMWQQIYHDEAVMKPVPLKEGVVDFLTFLEAENIPRAVATSTGYKKAVRKLSNAGILDFFHHLSTGDQVTNSKPHPEIYLQAAAKLDIQPERCLALEDSDNGVRAAHGANMLVFQIPDLVDPSPSVRKLDHRIIPSMKVAHALFKA